MRIINFSDFNASTEPLYFQHQILKLSDIVGLNNCLLVYNYLRNTLPDCFANYFKQLNLEYITFVTRSSMRCGLYVPSVNKTYTGIHSITFRSIQVWNKVSKTLLYKALAISSCIDKVAIDLSILSRDQLKKILTGLFLDEMISN